VNSSLLFFQAFGEVSLKSTINNSIKFILKYSFFIILDGVPIGPFQSRGSGTGDAFHAVRVGLVKNSHTPWDEWRLFPRLYQSGLDVAVASVECSVSGKYLKHLPRSTLILPPKSRESMDEESNKPIIKSYLKHLITFTSATESDFGVRHMTQSSVNIRADDDGLIITGFYPTNAMTSRNEVVIRRVPKKKSNEHSKTEYTLEIVGWSPSGIINPPSPDCSTSSECFKGPMVTYYMMFTTLFIYSLNLF
jgi:hypothetical protein